MKIAIDISPLSSNHSVRGVGFYLQNLKEALLKYCPENSYLFFTRGEKIPDKVDLVHYPYFDPFFLTLPLKKKHKTVVTVHDLIPIVFPEAFPAGKKGRLKWEIQKRILRKVDAIIADSEASKKDIVKFAGIDPKKVHTVYLAAGEHFRVLSESELQIADLRKKYKLPEKFALYVGDVTWNKNLPRLIRAAVLADVPLIMAGKSLAQKDFDRSNPWNADLIQVQELVENHKNVRILGFVPDEDLVALYNTATVFVFPSLYEGFGLPILEAMQSGCPVISSREGSIPEVAGEAAQFVDAYDENDITSGIIKVMEDKKIQNELIEKGLKQAAFFSWKKTAEQTVEVYSKFK